MIPTVIVTWPTNCDYPLWRKMIVDERSRFDEVIISFTKIPDADDFTEFVVTQLDYPEFEFITNPVATSGDWRDIAIKRALKIVDTTPYVWFTEQDFYPRQDFWEYVELFDGEVLGVYQDDRLHPCSIFMSRQTLDTIVHDFSAKPPEYDHFGNIQKQLELMEIPVKRIPKHKYFHFNGLSHNWRLITENQPPNYHPDAFFGWLRDSLECGVKIDPRWEFYARKALQQDYTQKLREIRE